MDFLFIPALALMPLMALGYVFVVIYQVLTSSSRGGVLSVLTGVTLIKVALAFLVLSAMSGFVFLGGTAGAIAGSGGTVKARQVLELISSISVFCFFVSLAFVGTALIRYAIGKKIP
ncbi:hypothetical protein [Pseudomonas sp. UBA1879]|uniref:hypothetical protein n=1 Tax=Pseudomonas sp. UBA1879 TaxID=1947305 RepID=UPI0025FD1FFB|nr:hypothetical protein [Pseudomonas sp. UBA1879]